MPNSETLEVELDVAPSRVWKATWDIHNIGPKVLPQVFHSIHYIKGDGGPGSIRQVQLKNPVSGEIVSNTEVVDFVDEKSYTFKYHVEEGELKKLYSLYNVAATLVPDTDPGKSKIKYTIESEAVGEAAVVEGEHKKVFFAFTKALEAYLLAHGTEYA